MHPKRYDLLKISSFLWFFTTGLYWYDAYAYNTDSVGRRIFPTWQAGLGWDCIFWSNLKFRAFRSTFAIFDRISLSHSFVMNCYQVMSSDSCWLSSWPSPSPPFCWVSKSASSSGCSKLQNFLTGGPLQSSCLSFCFWITSWIIEISSCIISARW